MRKKRRIRERCRNCRKKFRADRHSSGPARSCSPECREVLARLKESIDRLKAPENSDPWSMLAKLEEVSLVTKKSKVTNFPTMRVPSDYFDDPS